LTRSLCIDEFLQFGPVEPGWLQDVPTAIGHSHDAWSQPEALKDVGVACDYLTQQGLPYGAAPKQHQVQAVGLVRTRVFAVQGKFVV
jgi:hypothetical protein